MLEDIRDRYAKLAEFVAEARSTPKHTLNSGLTPAETKELLLTSSISMAAHLVRKGLKEALDLELLAP